MHNGGGGFSGGGGHDGGGFIGGGHHGGHDAGGGFGAGGHHHHHHLADPRLADLVSPTDPVYGNRYDRPETGSRHYPPAGARDRVATWILRLVVFAFLIFFIWWVYVEMILGHKPAG